MAERPIIEPAQTPTKPDRNPWRKVQTALQVTSAVAALGGGAAFLTGTIGTDYPKTPQEIAMDNNTVSVDENLQRWGFISLIGGIFGVFTSIGIEREISINELARKRKGLIKEMEEPKHKHSL